MRGYFTVGIAGHVDHGKTSLVYALTGVDTDRLREEKRRGLSIESGVAPLVKFKNRVALIDVPGHTDYLKNTIRGLSAVDIAILIVAADDGVMPQTIEHLQILKFFGIKTGFCVLSKADLVDNDTLEVAKLEVKEICKGTCLEGKPIIAFSAVDKRGVSEILDTIGEEITHINPKDVDAPFRLWIDQTRMFPGFGTVVTGTVLSGKVKVGDPLLLLPGNIETKARSLEVHHNSVSVAYAGQRLGMNLHRVPFEKVSRGMALIHPESTQTSCFLNVELQALEDIKKPIFNRQKVKLYLGTAAYNCLIVLMEKERLEPGEKGLAQLRLPKLIPVLPNDPFVVCYLNAPVVIGGGRVLQMTKEKFREGKRLKVISFLKAIQEINVKELLDTFIKNNPLSPIRANELSKDTGIPVNEFEKEIRDRISKKEIILFGKWGVLSRTIYEQLKEQIPGVVIEKLTKDPLKKSIKAEEIRLAIAAELDEVPLQYMLQELCSEGKLVFLDGGYKAPHVSPALSSDQRMLISLILKFAQKSHIVPFSVDSFREQNKRFSKTEIHRFLDYLCAQGELIRLNNRRYLWSKAIETIKENVRKVILKKGYITPQDSKQILGYGRSAGLPVFEYLDSIGFTCRRGNIRLLSTRQLRGDKDERNKVVDK